MTVALLLTVLLRLLLVRLKIELAAPFIAVLFLSRRIERLTTWLDQELGLQPPA